MNIIVDGDTGTNGHDIARMFLAIDESYVPVTADALLGAVWGAEDRVRDLGDAATDEDREAVLAARRAYLAHPNADKRQL